MAEAILYAVANGCRVVNMSFGDAAFSYLLRDAIQYGVSQGVLFVASAGNSGTATLNYPAAFEETVSVGATAPGGGLAGFSNYGSTTDLVAPAVRSSPRRSAMNMVPRTAPLFPPRWYAPPWA